MKRPPPPLQLFAALSAETAAMSSRPPYRGGRSQFRRSYSDRPYSGGGSGQEQFVTGDSHFRSVRDANLGYRRGGAVANRGFSPRYNQNQQFRQPPPPPQQQTVHRYQNQNQQFRHPPPQQQPFGRYQNQHQQFRQGRLFDQNQNQAVRPRQSKPLDYRSWEYAKTPPPPNAEKFVVLSYNILADYLANDHRSKLYYHVPRHMMDWEWRKRNIIFELGLWSADIMCFQEVDRFRELEEELKPKGYHGIWKMRTGTAIDGCAIFWRASRFKLLHEEAIEFNKHGLRDNVAQICVLEQSMGQNKAANKHALPRSSEGSNKVVICNIHVLYNPRRGEIKLGQVRMLLERAHAVSKIWDGAPVVLCGDFNCTPKSPLYNFIYEQKLDLTGLPRDKLSGQASAEIRYERPYSRNPNLRSPSPDNSGQAPSMADHKPIDLLPEIKEQDNLDKSMENISSTNDEPQPQNTRTVVDASNMGCTAAAAQCDSPDGAVFAEERKENLEYVVDNPPGGITPAAFDSLNSSKECAVVSYEEDAFPGDQSSPSSQLSSELSQLNICIESAKGNIKDLQISLQVSPPGSSECGSLQSTTNSENIANNSYASTSIYFVGHKQPEDACPEEQNGLFPEAESDSEEQSTHSSAVQGKTDNLQDDFDNLPIEIASDPDDSQSHIPSDGVGNHSLALVAETDVNETSAYDPSSWTPMEIATATGNADCCFLEHPLQLKSAYTEVQDASGTRDLNGEPLVTSYNRCFLGTVDYIWCSEGLQPARVLAPIPKHVMQWTAGFPTKKWGSDHIALACELAFTKNATESNIEVR